MIDRWWYWLDNFIMWVGERKDILRVLQESRTGISSHQTKSKVFPYLKSNNNFQQIDYNLYERLRRNKKLQLIRPTPDNHLFLEGELMTGCKQAPLSRNVQSKQKDSILEMIGRPKQK